MPSPFPGMDPYLERPARWPNFHHGLISEIQADLNRQLRPNYYARVEERVYLSDENDPSLALYIPDVRVLSNDSGPWRGSNTGQAAAGTIVPVEVTSFIDDEIHEARLEIRDVKEGAVVTVIEILNPTNKVPGSRGQESYNNKPREIMRSSSHLVEIDLLRVGVRIFIPDRLPSHDYLVHVSRAKPNGNRRGTVWPIPLNQPLPNIPIPLRNEDPDVIVDLQKALNSAYERGAYDLDMDYTGPAVPALTPEQAAWASRLIEEQSARH